MLYRVAASDPRRGRGRWRSSSAATTASRSPRRARWSPAPRALSSFSAPPARRWRKRSRPRAATILTMSVYEPMGVVAAITPWNSPIASEAQKLAPALAAGNAVVLKPAEVDAAGGARTGAHLRRGGRAQGHGQRAAGQGLGDRRRHRRAPAGASACRSPAAPRTGKRIAHIAADKMMPVSLELGGKSPTIVFEDADLDHAVAGVILRHLQLARANPASPARACSWRASIYDAVPRAPGRQGAAALRVGDPADERTQMGPLITRASTATSIEALRRSSA